MSNIPTPGQLYRHFKGNLYRIVTLAKDSETGENMVVYQALYGDYEVYVRPLSMFMEKLDRSKYPNAVQEYRFELQKELIGMSVHADTERDIREDVVKDQAEKAQETAVLPPETEEETNERQEIKENENIEEELNIDPLVLEFLDAGTYRERLNILSALHHRITNEMITTMAIATDLEVGDGDVEERYEELRTCLLTYERYEGRRLR
ncbi:DUF1653 domain-containing protein [Parablautia intestinalis]|jgi:hypothetical protein|uniref:DUF1653 domain-containing protein n=1 Tax=Parablautia intestinalis TaxID=2320100 RepID=A0A3A9ABK0_9FIRM|nr:DUF1653 domain-containing protein [Parablautia intestinalis]MCI8616557.1 DUF1653 domain-containing protein [Lachnospiraceae bacterium]MDE7049112.1 DUF1653 domain-containing protein [Lachnospiraceae bacterium]RKI88628.1 DUF1653 domain-containing protein [Parablautia intestinalis]